jgi:hypothetical protein
VVFVDVDVLVWVLSRGFVNKDKSYMEHSGGCIFTYQHVVLVDL